MSQALAEPQSGEGGDRINFEFVPQGAQLNTIERNWRRKTVGARQLRKCQAFLKNPRKFGATGSPVRSDI